MIEEIRISQGIVKNYFDELYSNLELDIAIAGAGPSGLVAGYFLAKNGLKVAIFERKVAPGGGIWGGGMLFNKIIFQKDVEDLLNELGVKYKEDRGLLVANSIQVASSLIKVCIESGCYIFNGISVEDVVVKDGVACGFVINSSLILKENLAVDPIIVMAKYLIDATGHNCEVVRKLAERGVKLNVKELKKEEPLWSEEAERKVVEYTSEVFPGLYVCGIAVCNVFGLPRMGPIFGGMLLSGKKVSELIIQNLK